MGSDGEINKTEQTEKEGLTSLCIITYIPCHTTSSVCHMTITTIIDGVSCCSRLKWSRGVATVGLGPLDFSAGHGGTSVTKFQNSKFCLSADTWISGPDRVL